MKKPLPSVFQGNLGKSSLWMNRRIDTLREIQKDFPEFNYDKSWELHFYLDQIIKHCEEMKTMGVPTK